MNLLRTRIISTVLASVGFLAISTTMPAQVTNGEKAPPVADAPSRADSKALQKKATEAQVRIHSNKEDRDQLMRAVKTNEVSPGQTSPPQKRIHR